MKKKLSKEDCELIFKALDFPQKKPLQREDKNNMPIISDKQAGELLSKAHHLGDSDEVKALRASLEKAKKVLGEMDKEIKHGLDWNNPNLPEDSLKVLQGIAEQELKFLE